MKEIVLTFNTKTGLTQVEANGFKGQACKQATMFLGDALGKVQDFQGKAEWYEQNLETSGTVNSNLCG